MKDFTQIDWDDPQDRISEYFTVHEALWLPSFRVYHEPSTTEKDNICRLADKMDDVREDVNAPIIVHVWIRPLKVNAPDTKWDGANYNAYIGSTSLSSAHITGDGVDWHAAGHAGPTGCRHIRQRLVLNLESFGLRMEDIHGGWIHNDQKPVSYRRFFKP